MRNLTPIALLMLVLLLGCAKEQIETKEETQKHSNDPLTEADMNQQIESILEDRGLFRWSDVDDHFLWSAAMQSDSIFALGYQLESSTDLNSTIHQIDIESTEWVETRDDLLDFILDGERAANPEMTREDLLPYGMPNVLPTMAVRITNIETVKALRANTKVVRYLESMSYSLPSMKATPGRSSSGCNGSPNYNINSADYTTISPNVKQSWHHSSSDISGAWNSTTGDGVTVVIIDTGASDDQENLGSQFNSGDSQGRTIEKMSTHYSGWWWWRRLDSPHDQCGHGTSMAGLAAAPRGTDGNAVGIAYNSDLISIRAVEDVVINTGDEKDGVKDALIIAGNRSDVKVISMSIGTPFYSGTVADGIYYAYNNGKMIIAAAGTSFSWTSWYGVIFPAWMSQTVAVTGVEDNTNPMDKCGNCHDGPEVDFVMVMERSANDDRLAIGLASDTNQPKYIGGSSAATASVAGIATLVFSNNPGATRSEVYNAMKVNASFYPNKDNEYGWGIIDAEAAVNE